MNSHQCLKCAALINLGERLRVGQLVSCPECGLTMELLWLYPLELEAIKETKLETAGKKLTRLP